MNESDLLNVPNLLGTMILDHKGQLVSSSGELSNELEAENVSKSFFRILQDTESLISINEKNDSFKRLTVSFEKYCFQVILSKDRIFIVKKRTDSFPTT